MNIADFEDLLDRLGDDIPSWPVPLQEAADLLLRSSEDARRLLDESRQLRRALSGPPVRATAGLTERILQAARGPDTAGDSDSPALPSSTNDPQSR
jgi:hypothetical protein